MLRAGAFLILWRCGTRSPVRHCPVALTRPADLPSPKPWRGSVMLLEGDTCSVSPIFFSSLARSPRGREHVPRVWYCMDPQALFVRCRTIRGQSRILMTSIGFLLTLDYRVDELRDRILSASSRNFVVTSAAASAFFILLMIWFCGCPLVATL